MEVFFEHEPLYGLLWDDSTIIDIELYYHCTVLQAPQFTIGKNQDCPPHSTEYSTVKDGAAGWGVGIRVSLAITVVLSTRALTVHCMVYCTKQRAVEITSPMIKFY